MKRISGFAVLALSASLGLAACGSGEEPSGKGEADPALSGALGDQIMVDPEMAGEKGAAVAPNGGQIMIPPQDRSPEAIARAQKQALLVAGGTMQSAPAPVQGSSNLLAAGAATAAQVAQAAKATHTDCSAKVQYSNTWAAKLPPELAVYPHGAVQEAAGIEEQGCALRVVNFATPVGVQDVVNFYYTTTSKAGYTSQYKVDGGTHVLGGSKETRAYVVYVRPLQGGLTEVDIVASGQ